jgi:hypothetical protein
MVLLGFLGQVTEPLSWRDFLNRFDSVSSWSLLLLVFVSGEGASSSHQETGVFTVSEPSLSQLSTLSSQTSEQAINNLSS